MPTRTEIKDWTRQQTLVEEADFADVKLDAVINEGIRKVAQLFEWPFLESSTTITLVDATQTYALPEDFASIVIAIGSDGTQLRETTRRRAQQDFLGNGDATPQEFYIWGEDIAFAPTPDAAPSFATVVVDYRAAPTLLANDSESPQWNSMFHLLLGDYAAARVWEREEDLDRAKYHEDKFMASLEEMAGFYLDRADDGPVIIGGGVERVRLPWSWMTD